MTNNKTEQGFTMVDVLVSILIGTIFTTVSMQAMIIAAYTRVRITKISEAMLSIQEDLEWVKYQAIESNLSYRGNEARCSATQTTGFADALRDVVLGSDSSETTSTSTEIKESHSAPSKQYKLQLTMNLKNQDPFNVLELSYKVTSVSGGKVLADLYTEVIPDAAFKC